MRINQVLSLPTLNDDVSGDVSASQGSFSFDGLNLKLSFPK